MTETKYHGIKSLAKIYATKHNTTYREAEKRVKDMLDLLEEGLTDKQYSGIQFIDSFTLKKVVRQETLGRNPRTGVEVIIPQRMGIKTELSARLRELI